MRIVFTVDSMNSGGAERTVATISNELSKMGHDVYIIMVSFYKRVSFYALNERIKLIPLLNSEKRKARFFKRSKILRNALIDIKPDIVVSFLPRIIAYTYFAVKKLRIPFIVSERNDPSKYPFLLKQLQRYIFKKATYCIFQTPDVQSWYGSRIRDHSSVILNPINITCTINDEYSIKKKTIVNVGRLEKQKNQKLLLTAFAAISNKYPDYNLIIYGEGSLKNDLVSLIHKYDISEKARIVGPDPDWQEKEKDSSVFVLSSDYEGMPNVLMEAMAMGITCVSTDCPVGGPRLLIQNGINGYLSPVNDCILLSKSIEKAIIDPKRDTALLEKASPALIANEWDTLFKRILYGNR